MRHKLSSAFSVEHQGISLVIVLYVSPTLLMENEKKNVEEKVVLLSGQYCTCSIPG
jgi:hypothetical protein